MPLEPVLKTLDYPAFLSLRSGATVLEADAFGDKVLALADGRILKLFRRKRRFSSAAWYPYAQRFVDNCQGLQQRAIPCPQVLDVFRVPAIARDVVLYEPLVGRTVRQLLAAGMSGEEAMQLRCALREFIASLHRKGVYFRSLHFGNIVRTPAGNLGLIDVADMVLKNRPIGPLGRLRNRKHWARYAAEAAWLEA